MTNLCLTLYPYILTYNYSYLHFSYFDGLYYVLLLLFVTLSVSKLVLATLLIIVFLYGFHLVLLYGTDKLYVCIGSALPRRAE